MLRENKTKLASLALAGALAVGSAGAASAQDWSQPAGSQTIDHRMHRAMYYRYSTPQRHDYGYQQEGYYRDGYDNGYRDDGPVVAAGAVVGSTLGTATAVATGYPYGYGYYSPDSYYAPAGYNGYGYSPDYGNYGYAPNNGNDWWGPTHNQYQNGYPQYQNDQSGW